MPSKNISAKEQFAKKVGVILQEARRKKRLTQEELAQSRLPPNLYWLHGARHLSPNLYSLTKIAKALGARLSNYLKS